MATLCTPEEGARLLSAGKLVAFPTETVYGLGADGLNQGAVRRVFQVKGRPPSNPVICHIHSIASLEGLAHVDPLSLSLAERYWPGPMTLLLPYPAGKIPPIVTAGSPLAGFRVPDHPMTLEMLKIFGGPVIGPSANPSGFRSPTTAKMVMEKLGDRIDGIMDGGPCRIGIESTVILPTKSGIRILRPGGLSRETLQADGFRVLEDTDPLGETPDGFLHSPGQLSSHYEPEIPLILLLEGPPEKRDPDFTIPLTHSTGEPSSGTKQIIHLRWGQEHGPSTDCSEIILSSSGDLAEAAERLYGVFDMEHPDKSRDIYLTLFPFPPHGLGRALNDRIGRAARYSGFIQGNSLLVYRKNPQP